jgi:small redox-active disulfide protein 2
LKKQNLNEKENAMIIKVLGGGCANCQKLEAMTHEVVKELGIDAKIEHVSDYKQIMAYGVMSTPGLVIDEKVVSAGKVPSKAEISTYITSALQ